MVSSKSCFTSKSSKSEGFWGFIDFNFFKDEMNLSLSSLAALFVKVMASMLLNLFGLDDERLSLRKTPISAVVFPDPAEDL